ncbi:MAG TPA: hypothetical protein VEV45_13470 [Streptosporangiaceae bacterium]|nr:hypothetical protein [Streptosporangiaceae bacterium]
MPEFLAEAYLSRLAVEAGRPEAAEVARAAGQLAGGGRAVRLTGCIYVPQDETSLFLFTAESAEAVQNAAASCGLRFERVVEAQSDWHEAAP